MQLWPSGAFCLQVIREPFQSPFFDPKSGPPPTFNFDVFDDAFFESFRMPALCLGCPTFWRKVSDDQQSNSHASAPLPLRRSLMRAPVLLNFGPILGFRRRLIFKEDTNSLLKACHLFPMILATIL